LVLQLARENRWGDDRITGELKKLGYLICHEKVRQILHQHGLLPVPQRKPSSTWQTFLNHYKHALLACDFFTVETVRLQTLYVFFFIELGTRRIHMADVTAHQTPAWVIQQARQFVWNLPEQKHKFTHLIRDNDGKYSAALDAVFASEGIEVVHTPVRAPRANAYAERWVRSVREECYEVTNAAYAAFVADNGYGERAYWSADGWWWKGERSAPYDRGCPPETLAPQMPRVCITWYEAEAYARWRGGALPTEAEWEYAARGSDGRRYPWGDTFDGTQLNYCDVNCANIWRDETADDTAVMTAPVGSYPDGQSWVGAYDMAGNVWEWTADWYDAYYHTNAGDVDPASPLLGVERVLRGGSWNMPAVFSRTAYRDGVLPDSWSSIIGFRIIQRMGDT
jgi:formylglycine-generating enzyme required for sulfatase activity